jgi:hypothetical protein
VEAALLAVALGTADAEGPLLATALIADQAVVRAVNAAVACGADPAARDERCPSRTSSAFGLLL